MSLVFVKPEWTLQHFQEAIQESGAKRFLIHDRDCIYSKDLDSGIRSRGLAILKTPVRAPIANAYCERLLEQFEENAWIL